MEIQGILQETLKLKTLPVGARMCVSEEEIPEKIRFPSLFLRKKITVCQAITMARIYGWAVGLRKEDFQCVPAAVGFGFSKAENPREVLTELFCKVDFSSNHDKGALEVNSMTVASPGEFNALLFAPLNRMPFEPQVLIVYGNAAQMMRITQAWSYATGKRITGSFGGKVECIEATLKPLKNREATIVIPGNGERVFAGTQDDELIFALPWDLADNLIDGLQKAGKSIGARYPIPPYMNYEPQFPPLYAELGKKVGAVFDD